MLLLPTCLAGDSRLPNIAQHEPPEPHNLLQDTQCPFRTSSSMTECRKLPKCAFDCFLTKYYTMTQHSKSVHNKEVAPVIDCLMKIFFYSLNCNQNKAQDAVQLITTGQTLVGVCGIVITGELTSSSSVLVEKTVYCWIFTFHRDKHMSYTNRLLTILLRGD